MQKKNKLNKTGIAVFIVAFCLVFFVLHGREVFSYSAETSSTTPTLPIIAWLTSLVPDYRFLEDMKDYVKRSMLEDVERIDELI